MTMKFRAVISTKRFAEPQTNTRGRSDKYLAYKRKTKILEKWRFISQDSLLLAGYT